MGVRVANIKISNPDKFQWHVLWTLLGVNKSIVSCCFCCVVCALALYSFDKVRLMVINALLISIMKYRTFPVGGYYRYYILVKTKCPVLGHFGVILRRFVQTRFHSLWWLSFGLLWSATLLVLALVHALGTHAPDSRCRYLPPCLLSNYLLAHSVS